MDFFHPLYWGLKDEFYLTFRSIYPPLNLFLLRLIGLNVELDGVDNAFTLRANQTELSLIMCLIYIGTIALVVNLGEWKILAFRKRLLIFVVCIFSSPVLFALERGNLIFFALAIIALYLNTNTSWTKSFYLGVLINIKPYFVVLLIQAINFESLKKKFLLQTIFFTILIFFLLGYLVGMDFIEYFKTYLIFGKNNSVSAEGAVVFANNLGALARINELIYSSVYQRYTFWYSVLKVISLTSVLILLYVSVRKPLNELELLLSSIVILTNLSEKTGGYILILYIVLIPYLIYCREYRFLLVPILSIFALPLDWINLFSLNIPNNSHSYLGGVVLGAEVNKFTISAGSIVRPLLNFSILWFLLRHLAKKY
jgi:hypothetical protein